jgi:hypothetical protein
VTKITLKKIPVQILNLGPGDKLVFRIDEYSDEAAWGIVNLVLNNWGRSVARRIVVLGKDVDLAIVRRAK